MNISYKPQKISPKFQGSVRALIMARIREAAVHPQFNTDVLKPLQIEQLMDQEVRVSFFNVYLCLILKGEKILIFYH